MSNIDQIINGDIDLYEYIGAKPTDTLSEIKRSYRRTALRYHPDKTKDPSSIEKFQLLSTIYEILSNNESRLNYNNIREYKREKQLYNEKLDEQTKRFKEELLKAEKNNGTTIFNDLTKEFEQEAEAAAKIERIRQDNVKRRRMHESGEASRLYISYRDIPIDTMVDFTDSSSSTKVVVKWKHRPELQDMFTLEILSDIMSVFGNVLSINEITNKEDKYKAAIIEYQYPDNAENATGHDYKQSASLWDGTSYRKLASLLRDCKYYTSNIETERVDGYDLTDNNLINQQLIKLIKGCDVQFVSDTLK